MVCPVPHYVIKFCATTVARNEIDKNVCQVNALVEGQGGTGRGGGGGPEEGRRGVTSQLLLAQQKII